MKIILQCTECSYSDKSKLYISKLRQLPVTQQNKSDAPIVVEMDCPLVPGQYYNVLLRGIFPAYQNNNICTSDVHLFNCHQVLVAVNKETELTLLDEFGNPKL